MKHPITVEFMFDTTYAPLITNEAVRGQLYHTLETSLRQMRVGHTFVGDTFTILPAPAPASAPAPDAEAAPTPARRVDAHFQELRTTAQETLALMRAMGVQPAAPLVQKWSKYATVRANSAELVDAFNEMGYGLHDIKEQLDTMSECLDTLRGNSLRVCDGFNTLAKAQNVVLVKKEET